MAPFNVTLLRAFISGNVCCLLLHGTTTRKTVYLSQSSFVTQEQERAKWSSFYSSFKSFTITVHEGGESCPQTGGGTITHAQQIHDIQSKTQSKGK